MRLIAWNTALILLLFGLFAGMVQAQDTDKKPASDKVTDKPERKSDKTDAKTDKEATPEAVAQAVAKLAGDHKATIRAHGKNYKAVWFVEKKENEALLDAHGKLIRSEIKVDLKDLPEAVRTAVIKKYGQDAILEFTKITIAKDDKVLYEVESATKGDIIYNAAGEKQPDDAGEADDDDDDDDDEDDGEEDDDDDDYEEDDD